MTDRNGFTVAECEAQERTSELLMDLYGAMRSKRYTVQVMHDGVEIIDVRDGKLWKKVALSEVQGA